MFGKLNRFETFLESHPTKIQLLNDIWSLWIRSKDGGHHCKKRPTRFLFQAEPDFPQESSHDGRAGWAVPGGGPAGADVRRNHRAERRKEGKAARGRPPAPIGRPGPRSLPRLVCGNDLIPPSTALGRERVSEHHF